MSKDNGTAASKAHTMMEKSVDQPHAHSYPGRKAPKGAKVVEGGSHNPAELAAGRGNSLGVSAGGSHKGIAPNKSRDYVGHDGYDTSKDEALGAPRDVASAAKHDGAELSAGRGNSMGTSADGSHKGMPTSVERVGGKAGRK